MAKLDKKVNTLETRLAKLKRVLRKWDDTEEGKLLFATIVENVRLVDSLWHKASTPQELEVLRTNKLALQMLMDCFAGFKYEVSKIEEELDKELNDTPVTGDIYS